MINTVWSSIVLLQAIVYATTTHSHIAQPLQLQNVTFEAYLSRFSRFSVNSSLHLIIVDRDPCFPDSFPDVSNSSHDTAVFITTADFVCFDEHIVDLLVPKGYVAMLRVTSWLGETAAAGAAISYYTRREAPLPYFIISRESPLLDFTDQVESIFLYPAENPRQKPSVIALLISICAVIGSLNIFKILLVLRIFLRRPKKLDTLNLVLLLEFIHSCSGAITGYDGTNLLGLANYASRITSINVISTTNTLTSFLLATRFSYALKAAKGRSGVSVLGRILDTVILLIMSTTLIFVIASVFSSISITLLEFILTASYLLLNFTVGVYFVRSKSKVVQLLSTASQGLISLSQKRRVNVLTRSSKFLVASGFCMLISVIILALLVVSSITRQEIVFLISLPSLYLLTAIMGLLQIFSFSESRDLQWFCCLGNGAIIRFSEDGSKENH